MLKSNSPNVFYKKPVLKNFSKFTGKKRQKNPIFIKLVSLNLPTNANGSCSQAEKNHLTKLREFSSGTVNINRGK